MGRQRPPRFPATTQLLAYASEHSEAEPAKRNQFLTAAITADAMGLLFIIVSFISLGERAWPLVAALMAVMTFLTVLAVSRRSQARPSAATQALTKTLHENRFHKRVNAMAAAFLERSASDWLRVRSALDSPFFAQEPVPQHWKDMRERIQRESDDAIFRLLSYVSRCQGNCKQYDRWYKISERVLNAPADELKRHIEGLHQDSQLPLDSQARSALPHIATIAWELRQLAKELQALPLQEKVSAKLNEPVPTRFDHLLTEIEELRRAEEELNQQQVGG